MRTLLHLLLCAALAYGVDRVARNGGFPGTDDAWLSWLRGNVERVTPGGAPVLPPLVIEITEGGGATDAWPPSALDYALLLDRLAVLSPATVAIGSLPPPTGDPFDTEILADKTAALASTVLPAILVAPPPLTEPDFPAYGLIEIPPTTVSGDLSALPIFAGVLSPAPGSTPAGFTRIDLGAPLSPREVPLLARTPSGKIAAGLPLAILLRHTGTSPADLEISLGNEIQFPDGFTIPVSPDGTTTLPEVLPPVPALDAASLFDPTGTAAPQTEPLPPLADRLLFLSEKNGPALQAAHIATAALNQKWVRPLPRPLELALWGLLALTATAAYRTTPARARALALAAIFVYFVGSLFTYSAVQVWSPLPVPAALLILITASAFLRRGTPIQETA